MYARARIEPGDHARRGEPPPPKEGLYDVPKLGHYIYTSESSPTYNFMSKDFRETENRDTADSEKTAQEVRVMMNKVLEIVFFYVCVCIFKCICIFYF